MGKASKGSRKGKKAWRANIRTDDIDDFFEKQTRDAHAGAGAAAIPSLPSDSLFFVDKPAASASTSAAAAASASDTTTKDIPVKRKIEKKEKVLYHESLLKRNPFVQPIPSSVVSKKDKKKAKKQKLQETQGEKSAPVEDDFIVKNFDIWAVDGKGDSKAKKRSTTSVIPAVEVEPAGCSFNPPLEAHQDSLAQAVADEKSKEYIKELGPAPVPLIVPGEAISEEDKFFLDADDGDEDAAEDDGDQDADTSVGQRKNKAKRVTRVELNKRARRKERLRAEAEAKKMENISKEIDSLPNIMDEIAKEDKEKEKRRIRRTVVKEERRKSGPPRLGRHKFEPAPVQVLLIEEISGSLRKLKGCSNLARELYKSIEKRGILAPSKRIRKTPWPRPLVTVDESVNQPQQCKLLPSNGQSHMILADAVLNCESSLKTNTDIPGAKFLHGIDSGNPACCQLEQEVYGPGKNKILHNNNAISGLLNLKRQSYGSTVSSAGIQERQCIPDSHEMTLHSELIGTSREIKPPVSTNCATCSELCCPTICIEHGGAAAMLDPKLQKKRCQPEVCCKTVNAPNTTGHDYYEKVKQIFVDLDGTSLSMQVNIETTTARKLVGLALKRKRIGYSDVYLLYSGKRLDDDQDLSLLHIPNNASFAIAPRARAGQDCLLTNCRTFVDFIKDIRPFYKVTIPKILQKQSAVGDVFIVFLSQCARSLVHMLIICLLRLHAQGDSLAGNFEYTDILFWHDCALIRIEVKRERATMVNMILDFRKLSKIIDCLFRRPRLQLPDPQITNGDDELPAHLGDLIRLLRVFVYQGDNATLRAHASNHPSLLSFRARLNKILEIEMFYNFLDPTNKTIFKNAIGVFDNWHTNIMDVPPLKDTYKFNNLFGNSGIDWVQCSRNHFQHPNQQARGNNKNSKVPVGYIEEQAEAALSLYCRRELCLLLLRIVTAYQFPKRIDGKLICGNEMADANARGGESDGLEYSV